MSTKLLFLDVVFFFYLDIYSYVTFEARLSSACSNLRSAMEEFHRSQLQLYLPSLRTEIRQQATAPEKYKMQSLTALAFHIRSLVILSFLSRFLKTLVACLFLLFMLYSIPTFENVLKLTGHMPKLMAPPLMHLKMFKLTS